MRLWTPKIVETFRRHPDLPGFWLYKEGPPFWGVWQIAGTAKLGDDREAFESRAFGGGWLLSEAWAVLYTPLVLWLAAWRRREWLKENGRRASRDLWERAEPLA